MGRSTLILVLVALLAGIGIGYVLAKSLGGPEGEAAPPPTEPVRPKPDPVKPGADLPPAPEGGYRDLAEALAAIPVPEVEPGTGVITGKVTLEDGSPVDGVVVTASRFLEGSELRPFDVSGGDEDLTTLVVNTVQRHVHGQRNRCTARTGPNGTYRVEGLSEGRHRLLAAKDGYSIFTRGGGWIRPGSKCDFQASVTAMLEVTVLMPDGSPAEKATVACMTGSSTNNQTWTPKSTRVRLTPGSWELRATAGQGGLASEKHSVNIAAGESPPAITLQLESRPGIRGKVVVEAPQGNQWFQVALVSVPPGQEADPGLLQSSRRKAAADRHRDNEFSFLDLKPGTYMIGLILGEKVEDSAIVTVKDRMVEQNLTLGPPDPGETFILVATGPDGGSVDGLRIQVGYRSDRGNSSGSARYTGLGEGRYRVWHHRPRQERVAEGGVNYVEVTSKEFGSLTETYDAGATSEITIRFQKPATLKITMSGLAGSGYEEMVSLSLSRRKDDEDDRRFGPASMGASVDTEGNKTFGPVVPGPYTVFIHFTYEEHNSFLIASEPVTVEPGANTKVVVMPALYTVTVNVRKLPDRARLSLRRIVPTKPQIDLWSLEPRDGKVVIRGLPAGKYTLRASGGPGLGQMNITVPGASVLDFEPKEANALQVTNVKSGGILENCGFRDGDMIVGIEGESFKGELEMQSKLMAAMSKGAVKVTVLRGARTLELELDLTEAFKGGKDIGGRMEPMTR